MNGFQNLTRLKKSASTRLITAENVYGEKGRGGMAALSLEPPPGVRQIGQIYDGGAAAARELGRKWKVRPCISLEPQATTTLMDIDGPSTVTHIWITVDESYLRDLILRMYWDGETVPSVEAPLGDLFCCGWRRRAKILSIPVNVNPTGGMNMYFPLPFRKHGRITVENRNPEQVDGFFYAISCEDGPVEEDEAYFHAQFRRTNPLPYGEDYVILDRVIGEGHYVGTYMGWQQNTNGWWGEGEIKVFIDGDKEFPSYCGTGTEDYFGGAWCFGENFSAPFLGYCDLSAEKGRQTNAAGNRHSMYRFHIMDPIRFHQDLRVTMQAIGWRSEGRYLPLQDDICSVAYWYQSEPHLPFPKLGTRDELECI